MANPTPPQADCPDALAALYLEGRDTPCPACGYNRRDGTAAACPECGHRLTLEPLTPQHRRLSNRTVLMLALLIVAEALLLVPAQTYSIIAMVRAGYVIEPLMWINFFVIFGYFIAGILAAFTLVRMRKNKQDSARLIVVAGITLLVSALPLAISSTVLQLL